MYKIDLPQIGSTHTTIERELVCTSCGHIVSVGGLCTWECAKDGDHEDSDYIVVRYEVTRKCISLEDVA